MARCHADKSQNVEECDRSALGKSLDVADMSGLQLTYGPPAQTVSSKVRIWSLLPALYVTGYYAGMADSRYKEVAWVGAMYAAAALGLLIFAGIAASGTRFNRLEWPAWALAGFICLATFIGFFVARTVGLPSYHPTDWPPAQLVAMVADLAYLGLYAVAWRQHRASE